MKNLITKRIIILFLISSITTILSINAMAVELNDPRNLKDLYDSNITILAKGIGFDGNFNAMNISINIKTNKFGHLVYSENYYSIDSEGKLKLYNSKTFYDGQLTDKNTTLYILRPLSYSGKSYKYIECIVRFDGKTVVKIWRDQNGKKINIVPKVNVANNGKIGNNSSEYKVSTNKSNILDKTNSTISKNSSTNISSNISKINISYSDNTTNNKTNRIKIVPKTPGFEILYGVIIVILIFIIRRNNIKK